MAALFSHVLEISLSLSALIALLLLARPLLQKRYRAKWAYWAWLLLALRLVIPFNPSLPQPPVRVAPTDLAVVYQPEQGLSMDRVIAVTGETQLLESEVLSSAAPAPGAPRPTVFRVHHAAALLWAAGGLGFLGWHLIAYARFRRRIRRWIGPVADGEVSARFEALRAGAGVRRLALARCPAVSSPMVTGFLRPVLLLPAAHFSPQALDAIFRHELVHAKRHDIWYKLLLLLARCVHWFNPLVHLMARRAGRDLEIACDEAVVAGRDEAFRQDYGRAVLDAVACAGDERAPLTTYFKGGRNTMLERLKAILSTLPKRRGIALLCLLAVLVSTVAAACGVGRTPADAGAVAADYYTLTAPAATREVSYSGDGGARFTAGDAVLGGVDLIPVDDYSSVLEIYYDLDRIPVQPGGGRQLSDEYLLDTPRFSAVLGEGAVLECEIFPEDSGWADSWTLTMEHADGTRRLHYLYHPSPLLFCDLWYDLEQVDGEAAQASADTFRFGAQFTPSPDGAKAVSFYQTQYFLWDLTGETPALTLNQASSGGIRGGHGPLSLSDPLWSPDGEKVALTAAAGGITTFCFPVDMGPFYPEWQSRGDNGVADLVVEALGKPFTLPSGTVRACVPLSWAEDGSALQFSYELVDADGTLQSGTAWYAMADTDGGPVFDAAANPPQPLLEGPLRGGGLFLTDGDVQVYGLLSLPEWPRTPSEGAPAYAFTYGGGAAGALELAPLPADLEVGADGLYHRAEEGMDAWYYPLPGAEPAARFTWRADQPELGAFLARHITFFTIN